VAQIVWAENALQELDDIAEYISLDKPVAAASFVKTVFAKVDRLALFPDSGRRIPEIPRSGYREIIVKPCRLIYRVEGDRVLIVHVYRNEQQLQAYLLEQKDETE